MPQRKDPDIPVRQAMVIVPWNGTSAAGGATGDEKDEQSLASNQWATEIKSASRTGSAMVQFELTEKGKYDRDKELDDIKIRLDSIHDLPQGAGPILYMKDFGDTSALMLTVASPPADPAEVGWVSKLVEARIRQVRSGLDPYAQPRRSIIVVYPKSIDTDEVVARNLTGEQRHGGAASLFGCAFVYGSGVLQGWTWRRTSARLNCNRPWGSTQTSTSKRTSSSRCVETCDHRRPCEHNRGAQAVAGGTNTLIATWTTLPIHFSGVSKRCRSWQRWSAPVCWTRMYF